MFPDGYNSVLSRYGDFVQQLSVAKKQGLVDFNGPVVQALSKAKALDSATAEKIIPDRVHPAAAGHLIMAEALLRSWNAPACVTTVEIDSANSRVIQAVNSDVRVLTKAKTLAWTQLDGALPMPLDLYDPVINLVLRSSDFTAALNQEQLIIKGLIGRHFTLSIDGQVVGNFSGEQLAGGINLSLLNTPMTKQAWEVYELVKKHTDLHELRWHTIEVGLGNANTEALKHAMPPMLRRSTKKKPP